MRDCFIPTRVRNSCDKNRCTDTNQSDAKRYRMLGKPKEPLLAITDGATEIEERKMTEKEIEAMDNNIMEELRKKRMKERAERSKGAAIRRGLSKTEELAEVVRAQINAGKERDREEVQKRKERAEAARRRANDAEIEEN